MPLLLIGYRGPYIESSKHPPIPANDDVIPRRPGGRPTKSQSQAIRDALAEARINVARLRGL